MIDASKTLLASKNIKTNILSLLSNGLIRNPFFFFPNENKITFLASDRF